MDEWREWQRTKDSAHFGLLKRVLAALGPEDQPLVPGELRHTRPHEQRAVPTVRMPYGEDVPILYAPAGVLRMSKLAYLLTWVLSAHEREAQTQERAPSRQVILLVDEPETHLHPRWQRTVLRSFRIHTSGTPSVDHMAPKSRAWDRVYEWENYRLAALSMNTAKRDFTDVIDPFEVQPGWFELELIFGQVKPGRAIESDAALRTRVNETIKRLGLNDRGLCEDRLRDINDYERGEVGWKRLRQESPFVAREIERQERRRPAAGTDDSTLSSTTPAS